MLVLRSLHARSLYVDTGIALFVWQLFLYPRFLKRVGLGGSVIFGCVGLSVVVALIPTVGYVHTNVTWAVLWTLMGALSVLRTACNASMGTGMMVMLNNSASPTGANRTAVHGLGQTVASAMRVCAPLLAGSLYTISLDTVGGVASAYVPYSFVAVVLWLDTLLIVRMPPALKASK